MDEWMDGWVSGWMDDGQTGRQMKLDRKYRHQLRP